MSSIEQPRAVTRANPPLFASAIEHHPRLILDLLEFRFALLLGQRAYAVDLGGGLAVDLGVAGGLALGRRFAGAERAENECADTGRDCDRVRPERPFPAASVYEGGQSGIPPELPICLY